MILFPVCMCDYCDYRVLMQWKFGLSLKAWTYMCFCTCTTAQLNSPGWYCKILKIYHILMFTRCQKLSLLVQQNVHCTIIGVFWNFCTFSASVTAHLTSLAVIPSMTWGRCRMQKTVTPSRTRGMHSETDGHDEVVIVALRFAESVVNWPFAATYQLAMLHVCPAT